MISDDRNEVPLLRYGGFMVRGNIPLKGSDINIIS